MKILSTSPLQSYEQLIQAGKFQPDANQGLVIHELERIYHSLQPRIKMSKKPYLIQLLRRQHQPVLGLYLWGGVGIGKTWLMDLFYDAMPPNFALRMHFHQFMRKVHKQLKQLQGEENPLNIIAKQFASKHSVLCFDEFFVSDITDAMLLAGLFKALFSCGITLVTTSNVKPELLYKGGVNRERFLPAIDLIQSYTKVLHLPTKKDYRLGKLEHLRLYYFPLTTTNSEQFMRHFKAATDNRYTEDEVLNIENREITTVATGRGVVWFDFQELCNIPRSQVDYLEIAKYFHTLFLSNVPKLIITNSNQTLYLINLVDILYDARVKLVISAECGIDELYKEGPMQFEFERTKSRLQEMQSIEYLQAANLNPQND